MARNETQPDGRTESEVVWDGWEDDVWSPEGGNVSVSGPGKVRSVWAKQEGEVLPTDLRELAYGSPTGHGSWVSWCSKFRAICKVLGLEPVTETFMQNRGKSERHVARAANPNNLETGGL